MWVGVTNWFAMIKFSASIKMAGKYIHMKTSPERIIRTPNKSLKAKRGLNETLSTYGSMPNGLLVPLE